MKTFLEIIVNLIKHKETGEFREVHTVDLQGHLANNFELVDSIDVSVGPHSLNLDTHQNSLDGSRGSYQNYTVEYQGTEKKFIPKFEEPKTEKAGKK